MGVGMAKPCHVYECENAWADPLLESDSVLLQFDTKQDIDLCVQVSRAILKRLQAQIADALQPQSPPAAS
jgi:hypothetical protein